LVIWLATAPHPFGAVCFNLVSVVNKILGLEMDHWHNCDYVTCPRILALVWS